MNTAEDRVVKKQHCIKQIKVEKLFGRYTYEIPREMNDARKLEDLMILYGDNGSGKTTILKLLYNVLLPVQRRGSKSFIAETVFKRFAIEFESGLVISAERRKGSLIGSYELRLTDAGEKIRSIELTADEDLVVKIQGPKKQKSYQDFLDKVSEKGIGVWFLADNRRFESYLQSADEEEKMLLHSLRMPDAKRRVPRFSGNVDLSLEVAIRRAEEWIKTQALDAANVGAGNVNTTYEDIIKRLVQKPLGPETVGDERANSLRSELVTLGKRNEEYLKFGLTSELDVRPFIESVGSAGVDVQRVLLTILDPYIDGIKARLDALESIKDLVTTFVENINNFYYDKVVTFDVSSGLEIRLGGDSVLTPAMLSSGEKQLLLLLCNTLSARATPSLFVIDEPELSLNVKWQRGLIGALLDCIKGSEVQFLLATHSIELLTGHKEHVVKLINIEREG